MSYAYVVGGDLVRDCFEYGTLRGLLGNTRSLRLTRHQIPNETHTTLYRYNTIHITSETSLADWVECLTLPQRSAIRSFEFETGSSYWLLSDSTTPWTKSLKAACASHLPGLKHNNFIVNLRSLGLSDFYSGYISKMFTSTEQEEKDSQT
jgi:hypothetical protein